MKQTVWYILLINKNVKAEEEMFEKALLILSEII